MKIGILHLTDLHFTENTNFSVRNEKVANVMKNDFHNVKKVYLLISGDIAFSGKATEYDIAKKFIGSLKFLYTYSYPNVPVEVILVPGNHDCNFDESDNLRDVMLKSINYETIGDDNSVQNMSLKVQDDFWKFYTYYRSVPEDKMFFNVVDNLEGQTICFTCLNTAWMSKLKESAGCLFFPVKKYLMAASKQRYDWKFGVWHHPINWFNPSTQENNKKEFQNLIEEIAPLHFIGHEHEHELYMNVNKTDDISVHILSGKLFNEDNSQESGFQTIIVEANAKEALVKSYSWQIDHFNNKNENRINLGRETSRTFNINAEFLTELNVLKIPLVFTNRKDVELSDIFVFPDMESANFRDVNRLDSYQDSSKLLQDEYTKCVIEGDSQIGKTSLISSIYMKLYNAGKFPILLNGVDLKINDLDKILKKAFLKQYKCLQHDFDRYMQLDLNKRVLIIDDFQKIEIPNSVANLLLEEASKKFFKVLVSLDSANSILPQMRSEFQDWSFFNLKPLGYKKRNDLIERYLYLKERPENLEDDKFLEYLKSSYDNVQNILGNKLMPSYPIFIISILQALDYKPIQQQETSLGYCYQTLIHYSLYKAGVPNEDIDSYFNYLTELAFYFVRLDVDVINRKEYDKFYFKYKEDYIVPNYEAVLKVLLTSKIVEERETGIRFGYKYILYYLSAKRISDVLHKPEGHDLIRKLFEKVHIEKNASILVFVTHHSKDISFIEESLINSMMVLDKMPPITLEKDDNFYKMIEGFAKAVKNDVLQINKNPREERSKQLKQQDEVQRNNAAVENNLANEEDEETSAVILPFQQSFRSIEIVGQIIRNRKGSLPRNQLRDMIKEIFTTGFRTVSYVGDILNNGKEEIIDTLVKKSKENESKEAIEQRVTEFVQMMCFDVCLGVFSKLMNCVGTREKELYNAVAADMDTAAAKLIAFSINSYFGSVSIGDLKSIENELRGNIVAMNILKLRVKSYVYSRNIDFKTKQKIASTLNMTLGPGRPNSYK